MKANPVYKCTRCGKIVVKEDIELSPDELSCVENISSHICDTIIWTDAETKKYSRDADKIGIIKLVGYNEVVEC